MVPKNVVLKLASITYSGKSIGNDIRIEIKVLEQTFINDITLNTGEIYQFNKEIGIFAADEPSFILLVKIMITEKDPIFDDVTSETIRIKTNLSSGAKQASTHRIKVRETRKWSKGKEAVFDVKFEIFIQQETIRYVEETKDGFLWIIRYDLKAESLPAFLKVKFEKREGGRDHFIILEGLNKGKKASVRIKSQNDSYLLAGNFHTGPANVIYSRSKKILSIKGKNYKTINDTHEPWKNGQYDIEIPDAPHEGGLGYIDKALKAKVWFHIGHNPKEPKYIHTGQHTLGCITLTEHERWDEVYEVLIMARKGDSRSVGILEVID